MSTALSLEFLLSDEWSGLGLVSGEIQTESVSSAEYKLTIVCSLALRSTLTKDSIAVLEDVSIYGEADVLDSL